MNFYHFKLVIRGLYQKKFNSLIKILGIILALVPAILIWSFVKHEVSYDKQFTDSEKIFRVVRNWQEDTKFEASTPVPLFPEMKSTFPEIETGSRILPLYDFEVLVNDQVYPEGVMLTADSSFFNMLNMELIAGDKNRVLADPGTVAISKSMADKLFGNQEPMGETIELVGRGTSNNTTAFTVGGVFTDFPSNSHFRANVIFPLKTFRIYNQQAHGNHPLITYLRLKDAEGEQTIEEKFPSFMENFYGKDYYDYARTTYLLQPITDIHLNTTVNYNRYETAKGSYLNLYIFPTLALLIMLIASFNFVNLSVSEGASKNKAFGINKILGSGKFYFFRMYILESLILTGMALIISIILLQIINPFFKSFVNRDIDLLVFSNPERIVLILVFTLLLGLINGAYPAYLFSSKSMVGFIREKASSFGRQKKVQNLFQVAQFAICIFFIAGSIVVFKQLDYISSTIEKSLDKDNVLIIKNADKLGDNHVVFKSELDKLTGISNVSYSNEIPGIAGYSHWGHPVDSAAVDAHVVVFNCDEDYLSTLKMQLVAGRFFDENHPTDSEGIILNETAVKTLGWQDDPLGKRYRLDKTYTVVGVVKDIYFNSLHHEVLPQCFLFQPKNTGDKALIKIGAGQTLSAVDDISALWSQFVPDYEMNFSFLNDEMNFWYQSERKTGLLALILSMIAITLSGLGLLALVLQSINSRVKEIGIRKANGAQSIEIIKLLNSSTVKWVVVAFLVSAPVIWFTMNKWLETFVYRTSLSWWIFAVAGVTTLVVALLTVSWQSYKAATRNPVEALRCE
ncbi:MAG: ABC transporter permease [Bacteroidota bacterium]